MTSMSDDPNLFIFIVAISECFVARYDLQCRALPGSRCLILQLPRPFAPRLCKVSRLLASEDTKAERDRSMRYIHVHDARCPWPTAESVLCLHCVPANSTSVSTCAVQRHGREAGVRSGPLSAEPDLRVLMARVVWSTGPRGT